MAQFSMEIMRLTGSVPRGNQHIAIMHDTSSIQSEGGIDFFDSVLVIEGGIAEKMSISAWRSAQTNAPLR